MMALNTDRPWSGALNKSISSKHFHEATQLPWLCMKKDIRNAKQSIERVVEKMPAMAV